MNGWCAGIACMLSMQKYHSLGILDRSRRRARRRRGLNLVAIRQQQQQQDRMAERRRHIMVSASQCHLFDVDYSQKRKKPKTGMQITTLIQTTLALIMYVTLITITD